MVVAYVVVNSLLALGMAWCAFAEFTRFDGIPAQMAKAQVPASWLPTLASVKVLALVGIVVGFWVPVVGTAAAIGVGVYFVGAILKHVTARDANIWGATFFILLGFRRADIADRCIRRVCSGCAVVIHLQPDL